MKTIFKYQLKNMNEQLFWLHAGAKLLHSDIQHGEMTLWFLVDSDQPKACAQVNLYATGEKIPDDHGEHVGTFVLHGGALVLHAFMYA